MHKAARVGAERRCQMTGRKRSRKPMPASIADALAADVDDG
jgi:hypothetical protein